MGHKPCRDFARTLNLLAGTLLLPALKSHHGLLFFCLDHNSVHSLLLLYDCLNVHTILFSISGWTRFHQLRSFFLDHGFVGSKINTWSFIFEANGILIYVLIYIDDVLITSNNDNAITSLLGRLHEEILMKGLGPLHYFLAMKALIIMVCSYHNQSTL